VNQVGSTSLGVSVSHRSLHVTIVALHADVSAIQFISVLFLLHSTLRDDGAGMRTRSV